jgi:glycogen operon protein
VKEVAWLRPDGEEMTDEDWHTAFNRCLGVYMAGTVIERVDKRGKPVRDNNFLVLFNAHHEEIPFLLPEFHAGGAWQAVLDTSNDKHPFEQKPFNAGAQYPLQGRSMALLIATTAHPALTHRRATTAPATQPPKGARAEPATKGAPASTAPATAGAHVPAEAAPAKATEPLPEKLGEDAKGG